MSNTYSIACKDCKEHIWVAQGWDLDDGHFYFDVDNVRKKLYKFLFRHKGHNLIFEDNCNFDEMLDYIGVE